MGSDVPKIVWADRYIYRADERTIMVGAEQGNFQNKQSLALPVLDFFVKHFPNYLSLHYETPIFVDDFLKIHIFKYKIRIAINL